VLVELNQLDVMFVHGDLKPSNILLDAECNIYVIGRVGVMLCLDFGMCNMIHSNILVKSTSHTYLYSPPEQVND
jgi:serine/threonine protein kinase